MCYAALCCVLNVSTFECLFCVLNVILSVHLNASIKCVYIWMSLSNVSTFECLFCVLNVILSVHLIAS